MSRIEQLIEALLKELGEDPGRYGLQKTPARLEHDGDALRPQRALDRVGDLVRQALLHLQPAGVHLDHARELGQADDPAVWHVRHVRAAEEGQQVVLAQAVEVDVLDDHHLAVVDRKQRIVQDAVDVGVVAARKEPERLFNALGRTPQPFPARIFSKLCKQ